MESRKSQIEHVLWTGQKACYDADGREISCQGSQDGELRPGLTWPEPRFVVCDENLVEDGATGLIWARNATLFDFPMTWQESLDCIDQMNSECRFGRNDWRLPNRREMRSLIDHSAKKPALPAGHPFTNLFLGWFWTSTTSAVDSRYAWYVHLEGGRMFYGRKDSMYWVWPVAGESDVLLATGEKHCFDEAGVQISCDGSGQDGALRKGVPLVGDRFQEGKDGILDRLTGLVWSKPFTDEKRLVDWTTALTIARSYSETTGNPWRLPTINELESLVDASQYNPALTAGYPFKNVGEAYWSSTTSGFEHDWAYVLYFHKGAVGVGYKKNPVFSVWLACDSTSL